MSVIDTIVETKFGGVPAWPVVLIGAAGVAYYLSRPRDTNRPTLAVPFAEPVLTSVPGKPEVTNVLIRLQNIFAPKVTNTTTTVERPASIQLLPTQEFHPPAPTVPEPVIVAPTPAPVPVTAPTAPGPLVGNGGGGLGAPAPISQPAPIAPQPSPCENMSYEQAFDIILNHPNQTYLALTMLWSFHPNLVSDTDVDMAKAGDATARRKLANAWINIHNISNLGKFVCDKGWG